MILRMNLDDVDLVFMTTCLILNQFRLQTMSFTQFFASLFNHLIGRLKISFFCFLDRFHRTCFAISSMENNLKGDFCYTVHLLLSSKSISIRKMAPKK